MWFGSWSLQNAGGGKAKEGSTLLFPQIPPASPAIPSSLFPPIPAPKSRADAAEGTAAPLVFTQIRKCQPHCRRADPEAGEQSVTDPGEGKPIYLGYSNLARTEHTTVMHWRLRVLFGFFSFSLQTYKKTLCNSHVHITQRKQL